MNTAIGTRIREIRDMKKMSQEEVANKLGFSRQRLGRLENGESDISYSVICKIAGILKVLPSQITDVAEDRSPLGMLFRREGSKKFNSQCETLFDILDSIYAQKNIYIRTKGDV